LGDEEIDEELALPPLLSDIGYNEKKELLRFKRTHNEVEFSWLFVWLRFTDSFYCTERLGGGNIAEN
jgi:hypothetical protein